MKRFLLISGIVFTISIGASVAQSNIVGKIDKDGNIHMVVEKIKAGEVLSQSTGSRSSSNFSEVTFSKMAMGEVCLTGYEKDANGKVISGVRIQCYQDDANNLIVKPENKTERIFGRPFSDNLVVSE